MSYILLITQTSDLAADHLILAAEERGIPLIRLNQDEFPHQLQITWKSSGALAVISPDLRFEEDEIRGAWFRRAPRPTYGLNETSNLAARESAGFLRGAWETMPWVWMNRPSAVRQAENKLLQLRHALQLGFAIPETVVTNCPEAARAFAQSRSIVAKTVVGAGLAVGGIGHAIFTTAVTTGDLYFDDAIHACPVIYQDRIKTSFDLRVTVVGDKVFAARIIVLDRKDEEVDWRQVDGTRLRYVRDDLPQEFQLQCVALVTKFGLAYGALDFVVTPEGRRIFLELNPSGQWGWIEQALRMPITDAILDYLAGSTSGGTGY